MGKYVVRKVQSPRYKGGFRWLPVPIIGDRPDAVPFGQALEECRKRNDGTDPKTREEEKPGFCANCNAEATHIVGETGTPLCATCAEVYKWGQASPNKTVEPLT